MHRDQPSILLIGLRDYGVDGQIGLEESPEEWAAAVVAVMREARRVLRDDGTLWIEIGDAYNAYNGNRGPGGAISGRADAGRNTPGRGLTDASLKPKDLIGRPWLLAFALRADGWYLRSENIWDKPNGMPESVSDRPTRSHSQVFTLSKRDRYYYAADEIRTEHKHDGRRQTTIAATGAGVTTHENYAGRAGRDRWPGKGANARSVWRIPTEPNDSEHSAVMAQGVAEICIKAGCPKGGTVLDPFAGSGTTLVVARRLNRQAVGVELNPEYVAIAAKRLRQLALSI